MTAQRPTRRRVGRPRRRSSPFVTLAAGIVVGAAFLALVGVVFGIEISHRLDRAWRYERISLTDCSVSLVHSRHGGTAYDCFAAGTAALPVDDDVLVPTNSSSGPPRSEQRWVHVTGGRIDRVGSTHASLWLALFLLIPIGLAAGQTHAVRRAHRAGLTWRDRDTAAKLRPPRRRPLRQPKSTGGNTPF